MMKKSAGGVLTIERKKVISIVLLFLASIIIILTGAAFSIISIVQNVHFSVFGSQIHGSVFGLVVIFLGVRYYFSVRKLKTEVYKPTSKFSWGNFRK